jgi:hypothetical protein
MIPGTGLRQAKVSAERPQREAILDALFDGTALVIMARRRGAIEAVSIFMVVLHSDNFLLYLLLFL